ncbi:MAG: DUF6503 family protein [Adhaeribacter sp.]
MRYLLTCCWCFLFFSACSSRDSAPAGKKDLAQGIIDQSIAAHGGKKFEDMHLAFDFRGRHYTATRQGGLFAYTRSFTDSTGRVEDRLDNEGFLRKVNGHPVSLPEERKKAFSMSVNSVIYFAVLPYGLNDPAVRKQYLGEATIRQQPYHKIQVSFSPEGGGVDHEDVFVYWIHQQTHVLDYLAYSYLTDGGGIRFRAGYAPKQVGGLRFQQYINYEPLDKQAKVADMDKLFESGQLKELSRIELENITVKRNQ